MSEHLVVGLLVMVGGIAAGLYGSAVAQYRALYGRFWVWVTAPFVMFALLFAPALLWRWLR